MWRNPHQLRKTSPKLLSSTLKSGLAPSAAPQCHLFGVPNFPPPSDPDLSLLQERGTRAGAMSGYHQTLQHPLPTTPCPQFSAFSPGSGEPSGFHPSPLHSQCSGKTHPPAFLSVPESPPENLTLASPSSQPCLSRADSGGLSASLFLRPLQFCPRPPHPHAPS